MPAHDSEVQEALEEGIQFKWLSTIKKSTDTSFTVEKLHLNEKGYPQPAGEFETIEADSLVLALWPGRGLDLPGARRSPADCGRCREGERPGDDRIRRRFWVRHGAVTVAVGHGKKAARNRCLSAWRCLQLEREA
jgi:hypothetical protein